MNQLRRRIAAAAVSGAVLVTTLTACGSSSTSQGKYGTLSSGTLKIAFRADDKPTSFIDNGKPAGFLVDLATDLAKRMGLKTDFVSTDFASILPGVQNHRYDTAAFGTLVTPDRKKVTNFTTATSYGQAQLVSRKAHALTSIKSSGGKTVAITRGSALIPLLQKTVPDVQIKQFPNIAASANALGAKQVDGLFTGLATVASLLSQHKDFTSSDTITSGMTAFPVAKDRGKLLTALNAALKKLMTDGTYTRLFDKWNPAGVRIPAQLIADYPGLKQRSASGS